MKSVDGKPTAAPGSPPLLQLLDRPIAFHRCFVTLTGSVTAALMLSQAIYWQQRTKDPDGWWYKTRDDWAEETGLSRYEQEGARKKLRKLGVVQEHLRGVPATIWYRVNEERLLEELSKTARQRTSTHVPVGGKPAFQLVENQPTGRRKNRQLVGGKPANQLAEFAPTFNETETTTEISTETTTTTTPSPSSTDEPKRSRGGRGGRGVEDPNQDPHGDHGTPPQIPNEDTPASRNKTQTARATEKRGGNPPETPTPVASAESINGPRPELTFPAKLTEREQEDIAAQVAPLPGDVAQQMLDVVEARIKSDQIRTNPAAMLRGIVRKYHADPASFDPSTGYHIADQRHRHAEAEARCRAAAESPPPRPSASETPPVRTENQRRHARQFVADALRSLRGG